MNKDQQESRKTTLQTGSGSYEEMKWKVEDRTLWRRSLKPATGRTQRKRKASEIINFALLKNAVYSCTEHV